MLKKCILLSGVSALTILVLSGCGGSDDNLKVKVIDGYVVGAKVCDSNGVCAISKGEGEVDAKFSFGSVITSIGGKIDTNFNGIPDPDEPDAPTMTSQGYTYITPVTTLVQKGVNPYKLEVLTGIPVKRLLSSDPIANNDIETLKMFNIIYPVLKEKKIDELVYKINQIDPLDLQNPDANISLTALAEETVTLPEDKMFIKKVEESNASNALDFVVSIDNIKKNPEVLVENENNVTNSEMNETDNTNIISPSVESNNTNEEENITENVNEMNESNISENNVTESNVTQIVSSGILYFESINKEIEAIRVDDHFELNETIPVKITQYEEFNSSSIFDINFTGLLNEYNYSKNSELNSSIILKIADINTSQNAQIKLTSVIFKTSSEGKIIQTDLSNVKYEINQTTSNVSGIKNGGVYSEAYINLSKAYNGLDEKEYNISGHLYTFEIDFQIPDNIQIPIKGNYFIKNVIIPNITLFENSILLEKGVDFNQSVGKTNVPNGECIVVSDDSDINGSINCEINSSGYIFLSGNVDTTPGVKTATISIENDGYNSFKDLYVEVVNPINRVIADEVNLSDTNFSSYHIYMELNGTLENNIITVETNNQDVNSSELNESTAKTIYIYNSETNQSGFIIFKFDDSYSVNDAFRIKRGDSKEVTFRVGDVDNNSTLYFK